MPIYAGILLCSLGVLMQEILLTRIFSFTIWYHLAYLTISTALTGFGAAGSLIAAFPALLRRGPGRVAALGAAGAGITLLGGMAILAPRPISPHLLLAAPGRFFAGLLGYYVVVTVPFLLAGLAVVAPLAAHPRAVNRLYAADLLGAGLGCAAAVVGLSHLDGPGAVTVCAAVLVAAGALYAVPSRLAAVLGVVAVALAGAAPVAHRMIRFMPTETKALGGALRTPGTTMLFTQWSPVNRVDLYHRAGLPRSFWANFGLSPRYDGPLPNVLDIQYDGHDGTSVHDGQSTDSLRMLDYHLLRLPYLLHERPRVLVIGVGGGIDVQNALRRGATHVTGVELQPITIELLHGRLAEWTGGQFQRPEIELVAAEGRHYVRSRATRHDILQLTAVDTFSAQATGAYVLAESYVYTVEAVEEYLDHLTDAGVLSIVLGDKMLGDPALPMPMSTRLTLVARAALERAGVTDPRSHIVLVGHAFAGFMIHNLLVKRSAYTPDEIERIRAFTAANGFDLRVVPGGDAATPVARLLGAPAAVLDRLLAQIPFVLAPVTDDRPFFFHVLRWRSLLGTTDVLWWLPGSATGQLMLLMILGQALVLGTVLILLPLVALGRRPPARRAPGAAAAFLPYFLALGLGFLLIEISFVQKYVLLLGYPTYSLSVTVFSLLVFAAAGAALSRRGWGRPRAFLVGLLAATVLLVTLEVTVLPWVRDHFLTASLAVRVAVTVLLQCPLGVTLGMYFPTGVELLRRVDPGLVPWAWAVNGVASVVSTVLAVMLGMAIGFSGVALVAAGLYAIGTLWLLAALGHGPARGAHVG
jgi:spermidine synthase